MQGEIWEQSHHFPSIMLLSHEVIQNKNVYLILPTLINTVLEKENSSFS